jgi:phage recombination protein Bet
MNALTEHKSNQLALAEADLLNVLQSSLYPGAALDSIRMVIGYCKAAGLDPMQKPVHIVPMWDGKAQRMRDVVMPGVNLYRIQASRSGQFAGISEPEFGPMLTQTLGGQEITFPEWCRVTVRRQLASGSIGEFTAREFWIENYAVKGGKDKSTAPNAMWTKRPRGQIAKCAAAQALRNAFPEIAAQYTEEEMAGKSINDMDEIDPIDQPRNFGLSPERAKMIRRVAAEALQKFNEDDELAAFETVEWISDNEEKQALWSILAPHSALRSAIKRLALQARKRQDELDAKAKHTEDATDAEVKAETAADLPFLP